MTYIAAIDEKQKLITDFLKDNFKNEFKDIKSEFKGDLFTLTYKGVILKNINIEKFIDYANFSVTDSFFSYLFYIFGYTTDQETIISKIRIFIETINLLLKNFENICEIEAISRGINLSLLVFKMHFNHFFNHLPIEIFYTYYKKHNPVEVAKKINKIANILKQGVSLNKDANKDISIKVFLGFNININEDTDRIYLEFYDGEARMYSCKFENIDEFNDIKIQKELDTLKDILFKEAVKNQEIIQKIKDLNISEKNLTIKGGQISYNKKEFLWKNTFLDLFKAYSKENIKAFILCATKIIDLDIPDLSININYNKLDFGYYDIFVSLNLNNKSLLRLIIDLDFNFNLLDKCDFDFKFIYEKLLDIINNKNLLYNNSIELRFSKNKINFKFSSGDGWSLTDNVCSNVFVDIDDNLNKDKINNLFNQFMMAESTLRNINTSLKDWVALKEKSFKFFFVNNNLNFFITYTGILHSILELKNEVDSNVFLNTIQNHYAVNLKLSILKRICYELNDHNLKVNTLLMSSGSPNYLRDINLYFKFQYKDLEDLANNINFYFVNEDNKKYLEVSIEDCPDEDTFIDSVSKLKPTAEFFYELKKLAKSCSKKNNFCKILVRKNKIIIIINDKDYVYDNVNLKNLHEKILIHLNN